MSGLSPSDVVQVSVTLAPTPAQFRNFGALLILGSSNIIDVLERERSYTGLTGVASDFGTTAPEYLAARDFFAQSPQPNFLIIGRFAQTATSGILHGAILTLAQEVIGNFNTIASGSFFVQVDGRYLSITGVNFTSALNLNGVATVVQTALNSVLTGTTCVYNGTLQRFDITSPTTGALSSVSLGSAPTASGTYIFSSQPTNNSIITLQGTVITFVTGTPSGNQVKIGADLPTTLTSLATFINSSLDANLLLLDVNVVGSTLYVKSTLTGTAGNAYTITAGTSPASNATASGATLSGGSGTDISTILGFAGSAAGPLVSGSAVETPLACVQNHDDLFSQSWYGLTFALAQPLGDSDLEAVAAYIEGSSFSHTFGVDITNTNVLNSSVTTDTGSNLQALNLSRTFTSYSSSDGLSACSIFGRAFTVNYAGNNTTITLMWKQEPGIVAEIIRESQAATLKAKNINAFVVYNNSTAIVQWGVMCNGWYIDERINLDWLQNFVQTNLYNFLYQTPTKVPQTDAGMTLLCNNINQSCQQAVTNGMSAPGVWDSSLQFGSLQTGDVLTKGYYTYAPPVALQSIPDRAARKSVAFQTAIKLAGAVHTANVAITADR